MQMGLETSVELICYSLLMYRHLALKDGVGHWMVKNGFQYVPHNQLSLMPAVN